MKITEMSKQDFASIPYLDTYHDWKKLAPNGRLEFDSLVVIPVENEDGTINLHDSGWGCMEFCLINENSEPIGKVGGGSDVVNLDGIGGYGYDWRSEYNHVPRHIPIRGWALDMLPCGYLRVWSSTDLFLSDSLTCSNLEVFAEDRMIMEQDLAEKIYWMLIEEGQRNLKFPLGSIITNTPDEVRDIIQKHIKELT